MLRFIKNPQNIRLIDIGCGNGYFLDLAKSAGMNVTGSELDPQAADFVKKQLGIEVYICSAQEIHKYLYNQSFNVVTLWGVLEHISNPAIAIQSIKKIMKKEGLLCLQTPSEDGLIRKVIHFYSRVTGKLDLIPELYNYDHVQCFSRKSIKYFLVKHGFIILRMESSSYGLKPLLQRPSIKGFNFVSILKKIFVIFIYSLGLLSNHGNHLTVYARLANE